MRRQTPTRPVAAQARVRRGYFECRYGQLHVHNSIPPGGGFEEAAPLLCLHDCPGSGRVFARFLALAGRDRSVYAPDLPGFGESDPPPGVAAIEDYAAAIGTELAVTRPRQIGRLVMVSAPLLTAEERRAAARAPPSPAPGDGLPRAGDGQGWLEAAAAQYPLRERLAHLSQRLLVLRPHDDLWEATGRVRDVLPAARLLELEPSGQELFASAAAGAADTVREFLQG